MPKKSVETPDQLSNLDRMAMVASDAQVRAAADRLEAVRLRVQVAELTCELEAQRLAAKANAAAVQGKGLLATAEADLEAKQKAHRELAAGLGDRYAVDWKKASFQPETGVIVRHS